MTYVMLLQNLTGVEVRTHSSKHDARDELLFTSSESIGRPQGLLLLEPMTEPV